ncbi:MAG: DJ-1/PfpI family protein [Anaerolineae bacterium]|jgi:4-methyl-5(b-hydroxyethyl)-thiazole monophosphate biosynthesis
MPTVAKDKVYVMVAPGFEEEDVWTVTRSLRRSGFSVAVVGLTAGPVRGAYGLSLACDRTLSEVETESPQAVVLPGGIQGSRQLNADPRVHHLLRRVVDDGGYVVALESAYTVLRSAEVLRSNGSQPGNGAATEPSARPVRRWPGDVPLEAPQRVVVDGPVIFGRDSGAAQEAALTLTWLLEQGNPGQANGW